MEAKETEIWTIWQAGVEALRGLVEYENATNRRERIDRRENRDELNKKEDGNRIDGRSVNEEGEQSLEDDQRIVLDSHSNAIREEESNGKENESNPPSNSIPFTSPLFTKDSRYLQETQTPQSTPFIISSIETWLRSQPLDAAHFLTLLIRWMRNALSQLPSLANHGGFTLWNDDPSVQHLVAVVAEMAQTMARSPSSAQKASMKRTFTELCDELASIAPSGMVHVIAYVEVVFFIHCSKFFTSSTETPLSTSRCVNTRVIIWRRCRWIAFWYSLHGDHE